MRIIYGFFLLLFSLLGCVSPSLNAQALNQEQRFQRSIKIGMTTEQVIANWGSPEKVIKKQGKDYDEIWIYIPHWKFKNYLYFKNGILVRGNPNPENLVGIEYRKFSGHRINGVVSA